MKKWFHVFFKNRWGRGQPDEIGAINLGDEKFDPDSDKKPRAGQILWIRGLTRLQTQVTIPISLSFYLSIYLSLSLCLSLSHSFIISHHSRFNILSIPLYLRKNRNEKPDKRKKKLPPPGSNGFRWREPHESHTVLLNVYETLRTLSFLSPFFSFLLTMRGRPFDVCTHVERTRAYLSFVS